MESKIKQSMETQNFTAHTARNLALAVLQNRDNENQRKLENYLVKTIEHIHETAKIGKFNCMLNSDFYIDLNFIENGYTSSILKTLIEELSMKGFRAEINRDYLDIRW